MEPAAQNLRGRENAPPIALKFPPPPYEEWIEDMRFVREASETSTEKARPEELAFIRRSLRSKAALPLFMRFFLHKWHDSAFGFPEFQQELTEFLLARESGAALVPRGHGKTTILRADCLHDFVYGREPLTLFYGATQFDSESQLMAIRSELEENELLRAVYGDLRPDPVKQKNYVWTQSHLQGANGVHLIARPAGKGRGVNVNGSRPTKIVIDDGETDEMVRSSQRRARYWRWLTEVIEPSLDTERGVLKGIGTVIHPECAVKRFYDERGGVLRAAVENGVPIWPERYDIEHFLRKRDGYVNDEGKRVMGIGARAFNQEFLNSPIGDGVTMFKQAWLDDNTYSDITLPPREQFSRIVMAVDPAAGESSLADDYGLAVVGLHRTSGKRYVLESSRFQGGMSGALDWFRAAYLRWQPEAAGIEANRTVQGFWQTVRDSGKYRVRKLRPAIGGQMASKVERAKLVEPHVEQGQVLFDPRQRDLYDQLLAFPSDDVKDDCVDAWLYAMSMLDEGSSAMLEVDDTPHARPITAGLRDRLM